MRCDQVEKLLVEYADGELNAGERTAVCEHVASCPSCADELAALERMKLLLAEDGYAEPSSFYWTRFAARLRERTQDRWAMGDDRWARLVPRLVPIVVAAAFFSLGIWVGLGPATGVRQEGVAPGLQAGHSFAEAPIVSPRVKLLVETGGVEQPMAQASDTLAPETFDPFGEGSGFILTGSEDRGRPTRYLGEELLGD
jgi:anti-sigma factor RsiW